MINKIYLKFLFSLVLVFSLFTVSLPTAGYAQTATKQAVSDDLQKRLAAIEEKVEARRKELGIPGMALAIVKDGEIIYAKGLGYKSFEKKVPVTADTQFAIGSATKAFTALSVLMSQEEGKLNLDDSPKKYLPYFKINNPETDKNITIRDLLSHSSGLNRTDLAMVTGKLNREELIRVAGEAKPTAGLREKFQYQNLMFTAAGEIVSKVQKMPWEKFIEDRIFKPLNMTNSDLSVSSMQRAKDFSFGYEYNSDTKETRLLPMRSIDVVAPAGSINSSANDMAKWLKFMLGGGEVNGKRLVAENLFAELIKPQMKISPDGKNSYGLGWFLESWKGMKVVQHGGNIDGFNSMVAMIPEKNLGFVMLTNVSASPLGSELMPIVWSGILEEQKTESSNNSASTGAEKEVGKYRLAAAGVDFEVAMKNGKLMMNVPGQPEYTLENVNGRKYKLANAPDGFFITFKDNEAFLEQPQGNFTLPKVKADGAVESKPASESAKELVGVYELEKDTSKRIEIAEKDGKVSLVIEGQPPYELREKSKDVFSAVPLPDSFSIKAKRDESGKLSGIVLAQPQGDAVFNRLLKENSSAPKMSVDELMTKAIDALGGEDNWRKVNSRVVTFDVDFVNQGVKGYGTQYAKTPNLTTTETTLTALGKPIGTIFEYFDGTGGGSKTSFTPDEIYTGKQLADARINADFYSLINWKKNYKKAELRGTKKVGDEDAYVVVFEPENGNKDTIYFSQKTFLPLKLESFTSSSTSNINLPYSETYSDYRAIDGVMIPFKTINKNIGFGEIVTTIKEVKQNTAIDDAKFRVNKEK